MGMVVGVERDHAPGLSLRVERALQVRQRAADKGMEMRRQGFFGAAMLPMSELEYTGIMDKLKTLDGRFTVRG
jgi:fructose 1,6-bisphosphatase